MKQNRATRRAVMARYETVSQPRFGFGPSIGPSWPDRVVDTRSPDVLVYEPPQRH
jgi:hypothetical protein